MAQKLSNKKLNGRVLDKFEKPQNQQSNVRVKNNDENSFNPKSTST